MVAIFRPQHQRRQRRPGRNDLQSELPRKVVAKRSRADLGNRKPARGNDQDRGTKLGAIGVQNKLGGALHLADLAAEKNLDRSLTALGLKHVSNIMGRAVAEKLPQGLLVVGNAMLLDQRDEIGGGVTSQRGFGEVRIRRDEVFRAAVDIGEIAAAPARDQDLLANTVGVLQHRDAAAALAGLNRAHQSGGAGAKDENVKLVGQRRSRRL